MFAAVAAWGLAAWPWRHPASYARWWLAVPAGLLLGYAVMLSYGLPLLGILALTVLALGRSWLPLPIAAAAALAVVGAFAPSASPIPTRWPRCTSAIWTASGPSAGGLLDLGQHRRARSSAPARSPAPGLAQLLSRARNEPSV